ncbi:hypothetical protein [Laceyella putida]|uniref:DZANK-type domain-containing protein n=1 Tax=Laceyella putida TaxID=110101 RepID=A0ABW2RFD8_9BACL
MTPKSTTACPVCNGFSAFQASCPSCGRPLEDAGRYMDLFENYSPYRPIDDLKLTDGLIDASTHQCPHYATCGHCGHEGVQLVQESMY